MNPHYRESIPLAMRERPQWVLWRYEDRDGRRTKAPWKATDPGTRASSTNPGTWATFKQAADALDAGHGDGLGYVFAADDEFVGVDIDDMDEDDQWTIVEELQSYTERSPSGNGFHVVVRATVERGRHPKGLGVFQDGRYFTVTGERVREMPATIEYRQNQIDAVLDRFMPAKSERAGPIPQSLELDDHALLEKARNARNGHKFSALFDSGDISTYASASEADLALCNHLAFYTQDPAQIDRLFRSSALMRDKWDRPDYRAATITESIEGHAGSFYEGPLPEYRSNGDRQAPAPSSSQPAAPESAESPPAVALRFVGVREFAAVDEKSAEPLIGTQTTCILSLGGMLLFYGDGGAGKTTLELDMLMHLATGREWIGLPAGKPAKVGIIENEGPRGMFRLKLRKKLTDWDGDDPNGNMLILDDPWAVFSFTADAYRDALAQVIEDNELDVIAAGPVNALGMQGGGTPDEVGAFNYQVNRLRAQVSRPVAIVFAHHENKAGGVAGAWQGIPDTNAHVQKAGNGQTKLHWEKVRWGEDLHGTTQMLRWTEGQGFEPMEQAAAASANEVAEQMLSVVAENPNISWSRLRSNASVRGRNETKEQARDLLLGDGRIVNTSDREGYFKLCLPTDSQQPIDSELDWDSPKGGGNDDWF